MDGSPGEKPRLTQGKEGSHRRGEGLGAVWKRSAGWRLLSRMPLGDRFNSSPRWVTLSHQFSQGFLKLRKGPCQLQKGNGVINS